MNLLMMSFCIMCIMYIVLNGLLKEGYLERQPMIIYKVNVPNQQLNIYDSVGNIQIEQIIQEIPEIRQATKNDETSLLIKDASYISKSDVVLTSIPENKIMIFVSKDISITPLTSWIGKLLTRKDKCIINIFDDRHTDYVLLILQCCNIPTSVLANLEFNKHSVDNSDTNSFDDITFINDTPTNINAYYKLSKHKFNILSYEDCNVHKMYAINPLLYFKHFDMSVLLPSFRDRFPIRRVLCIDIFITVVNERLSRDRNAKSVLYKILQYNNNDEAHKNNYYTMFFNYSPVTLQYLQRYNTHVVKRVDLPILEQYSDSDGKNTNTSNGYIEYKPRHNVNGYLKGDMFMLYHDNIEGIPVIGTTFILEKQERKAENGIYRGKPDNKMTKEVEPMVTRAARCVDVNAKDIDEKSQQTCEKSKDPFGRPKAFHTYWDTPCYMNEECPFYQANKLYKNYRGGCNNGYCEMPIGIKRVAFTKYDQTSQPICHNCPMRNIYCCDIQNKKDYAFELDNDERLAQGIE